MGTQAAVRSARPTPLSVRHSLRTHKGLAISRQWYSTGRFGRCERRCDQVRPGRSADLQAAGEHEWRGHPVTRLRGPRGGTTAPARAHRSEPRIASACTRRTSPSPVEIGAPADRRGPGCDAPPPGLYRARRQVSILALGLPLHLAASPVILRTLPKPLPRTTSAVAL